LPLFVLYLNELKLVTMKKLLLLLVITITALASCQKYKGPDVPKDRLKDILLKDTLQLYVGETRNVPVTISPSNYHLDSIKFVSSDTTVVTISNAGLLVAKKVGLSKITISNLASTVSISSEITVVPAPIDSLKLGLIAYYPFNNSAADSSGKGNNGTDHNLTPVADRFGNPNAAFSFDGVKSYVSIPDNLYMRLYNTDFTISTWVKLVDYNSSYGSAIIGKRIPGIADAGYTFSIGGYELSDISTAPGLVHFGPGGGSLNNATGTIAVPLNQWHMISCVYDYADKKLSVYMDGILDNVSTDIAAPDATVGAKVYIGRDDPTFTDNGYFLNGSLDDIRMYNRALSNTELKKLFTRPN
jgi:hypothetical protein